MMDYLSDYNGGPVTWSSFFYVAAIMAIVYLAVLLLRRRLDRGLYLREADGPIRSFTRNFLLLIDPLAAVVLVAVFIAIAPFIHGVVVLLLVVFGLEHLRHYIAGRILRLDPALQLGKQLSIHEVQGTVAAYGLTSLFLQRENGRVRIPFSAVLKDGYTVANDPERGGYFHVQVVLPGQDSDSADAPEQPLTYQRLCYLLTDSPYVKADFRMQRVGDPTPNRDEDTLVDITLGVHRADHVRYFIHRLREAGYTASLTSH